MINFENKMAVKKLLFVSFCAILSINTSLAQYGGGYGGGGYGGGGYGGGYGRGGGLGNNIPQAEPKFEVPDPEKVSEEETKWMKKVLKITEEQLPHIEDLNLKYASLRGDLYAMLGDKPDQEKMNMISPRLQKLYEAKEKELEAMVTPEQWEKYKKENLKKRR